jgi:rhamnogalacturonan endolyase
VENGRSGRRPSDGGDDPTSKKELPTMQGNPVSKRVAALLAAGAMLCLGVVPALAADQAVTIAEDANSYTLDNGIVTAKILKNNGDILSMMYQGADLLTDKSGHAGGYWSHSPAGGQSLEDKVTIDPKTNGGERAEVSIKGISGGKKMGTGPGAAAGGDFPADIEIRWSLGKGDSGIYTYCIFEHQPAYGAATMTEARFCAKLAAYFDWMSVDKDRNKYYPEELPGEDKYVYTAIQSENLAYGWSSTTKHVGMWIVNPTVEYLSGGPTKPEFLCHRDTTAVQAPCVLNYWRSSHYGGANVTVAEGEHWTKVIGPFMLYANSGGDAMALWKEALAKAETERAKWPYGWVDGVDYPHKDQRSTVGGRLVLDDPLAPAGDKGFSGKLMVGLTYPAYTVEVPFTPPAPRGAGAGAFGRGGRGARGARGGAASTSASATVAPPALPSESSAPPQVQFRKTDLTWQTDAKHYEFWAEADAKTGKFEVPDVRPGEYTLYAYADGVLGAFEKADVKVPAGGKPLDLGDLKWTPVREGKQLWEVGTANRTSLEFADADKHFVPDILLQYTKEFPNDVHFAIGKSDPGKDWFYAQIPHNEDGNISIVPFSGVQGTGRATPYEIAFDAASAPKGKATLRLAICGTAARTIEVSVNGKPAGTVSLPQGDGVITRHQVQGIWYERELAFDASLMKQGANTLTLTVPAGPVNNGVIYDYVRLELDENAQPPAAASATAGSSAPSAG